MSLTHRFIYSMSYCETLMDAPSFNICCHALVNMKCIGWASGVSYVEGDGQ